MVTARASIAVAVCWVTRMVTTAAWVTTRVVLRKASICGSSKAIAGQ